MADGVNSVHLLGNLGADPELNVSAAGTTRLTFSVATNESWLDSNRQRQQRTDWHEVVVFGNYGGALAKMLRQGSQVFIEGSLRNNRWDHEGKTYYRTEVHASKVVLCGSSQQNGE